MKKIKLIVGDNFKVVNFSAIKTIDKNNLDLENIVIVPDRFSLLMEKLIFKALDISATFNISVMGISQLADLLFKKLNLEFEFVNKQESILLIRKAMINKKDELTCFNIKINNGLVEEIYNSIAQFKSNEVSFEDVKNSYQGNDKLLKTKMQDLAIIFEEYEHLLNGKLDSTNILSKLEIVALQLDLSNYNFYYLNFDSFTKQGYSVLKNLTRTANDVIVGIVKSGIQSNAHIYEDDVFEKISLLAKENNYNLEIKTIANTLNKNQSAILKNLFAIKIQKEECDDFLTVLEAQNVKEEVEHVAKIIKNFLYNGGTYKNISIACSDLSKYQNEIERVFDEYNFKFYIDTNISLKNTTIVNFILLVLKILQQNYQVDILQSFIINDFNGLEKNEKNIFLKYIEKYGIQSAIFFETIKNEEINKIKDKLFFNIKKLNNIKNNSNKLINYINLIKKIINLYNLKEINLKIINNFKENNQIKLEKLYTQIFDKIELVLEMLEKNLENDEINFSDFIDLFENAIKNQELSTVPICVDSIFVGDATTSFFEETEIIFVLGASESTLPRYLSDSGLISDNIIEQVSDAIQLTPTVKMINRRNRFKIFNLLLNAQKHLYVSYCISENGEKSIASGFIDNLLEIFGKQNLVSTYNAFSLNSINKNEKEFAQDLAYSCGTKNKAKQELLNLSNQNQTTNIVFNSLYDLVKQDLQKFDNKTNYAIENVDKLFFKNNKTKISQIEKYFSCPYKQFIDYGLKLKESENALINNLDIGNILHEVAHMFLNPINKYIDKINNNESIENIVELIFAKIENDSRFYKINLKINNLPIKIIKEESVRLCKYLFYTQSVTRFNPEYLEVYFGNKEFHSLEISVKNKKFNIVGVVDRVDVCDDMFTVIDYKTGQSGTGSFTEVFYGDKIQIFVYMIALKNIIRKKPCGVYYFPIKNEFKEDDTYKGYMLKGKSVNDIKFLSAMDTSLNVENPKSKIFPCALSTAQTIKTGQNVYNKSYVVDEIVLNNMANYSLKLSEKALSEMLEGNIIPSPRNEICNSCPYSALCESKSLKCRKNIYSVDKKFFEEYLQGESNE